QLLPHYRAHFVHLRLPVATKQEHRWSSVMRDRRLRGVHDEAQVQTGENLLDERTAVVPLHELVVDDQAYEPVLNRELKAAFREWRAEVVLLERSDVPRSPADLLLVIGTSRPVVLKDIWRIRHDCVESTLQDFL